MFPPTSTSVSVSPNVNVTKGASVNLTCSSDANPPVESYTWFKVNESTPVGSGQQYSITNISSEDGGQYYCVARNKYGAETSMDLLCPLELQVGAHSPVLYVVAGVSVCGAAGLICVLVWIRRQRTNAGGTRKKDGDDVQFPNADIQRTSRSRAAGPPSAESAGAPEEDVQYARVLPKCSRESAGAPEEDVQYSNVQPKRSRQTAGGAAEDDGLYACVLPKCFRESAGAQEDDVQYASVQIKKARAAQGSPNQPEGECRGKIVIDVSLQFS
ncbi:B-cell receptor CD22-like [Alosa sapidissima]|uniref:B-cell receptor CD22-like n=1 Tax=Alosa sapidissima TaxID=34773 RepID=UPI001C07F614|nr:B-cell receptor CD22-like [Alosa sapidissima]